MSGQPFRLPAGGRIDRSRPLAFTFNRKRYTGYQGDTLASALLANGVRVVARSFKFHRPRGIVTAGSDEPAALVQVGAGAAATDPNLRATQVELYDGLVAASQNCWPSVDFDLGVVNDLLSPLLPAGFYYKTLIWPPLWRFAEPLLRRATGLGRAPRAPDPARYDKVHVHCDVLVVGAGPAGLTAALAAGRTGARVILADEQAELGGSLLGGRDELDGAPGAGWVAAAVAELSALEEVTLLPRATVAGYYDHNYLTIVERRLDHGRPDWQATGARQRLWKVRARRVVLATGAHERPLVFHANDRPGVMLASAAQGYANRYAVRPGRRGVVFTNNDGAYAAALDLADAGVAVMAVVDVRDRVDAGLAESARARGIEVRTGEAVVAARGRRRVRSAEVRALDSGGLPAGRSRVIPCDLLCVSGGWNPAVHLFSQSGGTVRFDAAVVGFVPDRAVQAVAAAGAANGTFTLADCLEEGDGAGRAAAIAAGFKRRRRRSLPAPASREPATPPAPVWWVPPAGDGGSLDKHFVDLQNDVSIADIELAVREGYRSVEHLKRYTTTGMGTDQGKTGNVTALALLAETLGVEISAVGTTTFRPPYTPVAFGAIAGRDVGALADPARLTPMHHWHVARGARFEDVGQWKRPWYYPAAGESMADAVNRECLAVRDGVGLFDASTLGKIDLQGPDTVELLNRVYTNDWDSLEIGRCRYGLMCGEDGMIFDDGVTARLAEHHYLMTTTTGNAGRVLAWLEEWRQNEWPDLDVYCASVTEQWANATIAGPLARDLLADLTDDIALDPDAFPFMAVREGRVAGLPARVFRVSFTGGLGFEVNVPARFGAALWSALAAAGERHRVTPFGTEALHVLRAERGYIIVGQETDGTVNPHDLGLGRLVSAATDFIGRRSLSWAVNADPDRKQLVGLLTADPGAVLPEGGQILASADPTPPEAALGHVTSSYWSAHLGRSIALALLARGRQRLGETVHVPVGDRVLAAIVTDGRFDRLPEARPDG